MPLPTRERLIVQVAPAKAEEFRAAARAEHRTVQGQLAELIDEFCERSRGKREARELATAN